ncbi:hypothetical protein B0H17DRAFT_1197099 [Mycena rosella]|uniref:Uncharacterized protein n=1 Tax=Mycena rosella TaxID=1033263 RepID=A0AAD7DS67_MYCRO|nr:hypothetical protein B0H17DRAFT_1197099 [Mycena rosella]
MFRGDFFIPSECLALLAHAPRLTRCEFRSIEDADASLSATVTPLLLSWLEDLGLASNPDYEYETSCLSILQSLNLPRLHTLDLRCYFPFNDASFISFLKRSPDIQIFIARSDGPDYEIEDGVANSVFTAMRSVTALGLHLDTEELFDQIILLLPKSPSFLPRIHTLTFSVFLQTWGDTHGDMLVDALAARWEPPAGVVQLRDFEFTFPMNRRDYETDDELDHYGDNVAERLQRLTHKGMELHIGPRKAPWL